MSNLPRGATHVGRRLVAGSERMLQSDLVAGLGAWPGKPEVSAADHDCLDVIDTPPAGWPWSAATFQRSTDGPLDYDMVSIAAKQGA
jgi:hypothetical protein